jgi:hypothetical protein
MPKPIDEAQRSFKGMKESVASGWACIKDAGGATLMAMSWVLPVGTDFLRGHPALRHLLAGQLLASQDKEAGIRPQG